jgi:hypothetical protein
MGSPQKSTPLQSQENPSSALTLQPPSTKPLKLKKGDPSQRDFKRWALWRQQLSVEEIAARWCTSIGEIQLSINKVQEYQHLHSHEAVDIAVNKIILNLISGKGDGPVEQILRDLADAKKMLCSYGPNGEPPILEPDHETRVKFIDGLSKLIDKVRPKGAGINLNLAQTNNTLNVAGAPGKNFEGRLRERREQRGLRGGIDYAEATPLKNTDGSDITEAEYADEAEDEVEENEAVAELEESEEDVP